MRLKIVHKTHYSFQQPVSYGLQQLRKTPKSRHQQMVHAWETDIEGGKKELSYTDHHDNTVELISFDRGATAMTIVSRGEVEVTETHGVVGKHIDSSPLWMYQAQSPRTKAGTGIRKLVREVKGETEVQQMHSLMKVVGDAIEYKLGASEPEWTAEEALTAGQGVCQDHAHVFLSCVREMGLPGRYVSGYLMMDDRIEQDAMHAWAEAYLDGLGWVGFDVSNAMSPDMRYVRVATGLDYSDAAPVTGTRIGGEGESLVVQIEVAQQQ